MAQRKPFFKRSTLWLMIYLLIPAIYILNKSSDKELTETSFTPRTEYSFSELKAEPLSTTSGQFIYLPSSARIGVAWSGDLIPKSDLELPPELDIDTQIRRGQFQVYLWTIADNDSIDLLVDFLQIWLPADSLQHLMLAGDLSFEQADKLAAQIAGSRGEGLELKQSSPSAITRFTAPSITDPSYTAFAISVELLNRRMVAFQHQVQWSHVSTPTYVLLDRTLSREELQNATPEEFEQLMAQLSDNSALRPRPYTQILRQMMAVYQDQQNWQWAQQQSLRLNSLKLADINYWFERWRNGER